MELQHLINRLNQMYDGEPWFGRSAKSLLSEVNDTVVFFKPNDQHSVVELLWHMINWREFTISRLTKDNRHDTSYFEENDWKKLDLQDQSLWKKGVIRYHQTQSELITAIQNLSVENMEEVVEGRTYNYRQLVYGILEHDIYHLGQIAYIVKVHKH